MRRHPTTARPLLTQLGLLALAILNVCCTEWSAPPPTRREATEARAAPASPADKPESTATASDATAIPATPVGAQFASWLAVFNSGDREALLAYHERHFPYSVASPDVGDIEREHRLSLGTGGFTEKRVEESTPTALTILLQERARPQFARVRLHVAPSAPHRVLAFEIGPIPTPPQFLSPDELARRSLDPARRRAVIDALKRELEQHYVFPDVAHDMAEALERKAASGGYDVTDAVELAQVLTRDLQQVSRDKHLVVRFGRRPPPPPPPRALSEAPPPWMVEQNFGFGSIEALPGNVALLTINGFVPLLGPAVEEAIGARMSEIADADAVILDLRANHGGAPDTVAFVASYFFEPAPLLLNTIYRRDTDHTERFWSRVELPGRRFGAARPVRVLTSARTFSGGEDLAYTLQAHQRAIVIGEVTGGGAHPTEARVLDADLHVMIPWGRSINPITNGNWEGTGVRPDVVSSAEQALERALETLRTGDRAPQ